VKATNFGRLALPVDGNFARVSARARRTLPTAAPGLDALPALLAVDDAVAVASVGKYAPRADEWNLRGSARCTEPRP
jgi:hypothetical protein